MKGINIVQRLFQQRLSRGTDQVLQEYASFARRHEEEAARGLTQLAAGRTPAVVLGTTPWGQELKLPLDKIIVHGLALGSSGAGKSYFALWLILRLLEVLQQPKAPSFGLLDAKGELFEKAMNYLRAFLYRLPPEAREGFKKRIMIIDFADATRVTPYNILACCPHLSDELLVANRIDTIGEQFSGISEMSVRMRMILKYFFLLMTEFDLPISFFEPLCADPMLLSVLVDQSQNPQVRDYFLHRFEDENTSTLLALRQRIDAFLISEGVRLSLSAVTAPDFARLQDEGNIILIRTAGPTITRSVSETLEGMILSDIKQSVFRRLNPQQPFLWFFDEAQNLFRTRVNREHMIDLLTMARSFGSFFALLTQSLTSAVRDPDILNSILANVRWVVMLRSTLRDAELIAPAIPATGNMIKPKHQPFESTKSLTEAEELKWKLKEVTRLPDRQAYCWLKASLDTAVKITTPYVPSPHEVAGCSPKEFEEFASSESLGQGIPQTELIEQIAAQRQRLTALLHAQLNPLTVESRPAPPEPGRARRSLVKSLEEEYSQKERPPKR